MRCGTFMNNLLSNIVTGIVSGIIASVIVLIVDRLLIEYRIRKQFHNLEGNYIHLSSMREEIIGCTSKFKYNKRGKFLIETKTPYGGWRGEIKFYEDFGIFGSGSFKYLDKDEGGLIHLQIFSKEGNNFEIAVYPTTLTHLEQKRNFYILKKI